MRPPTWNPPRELFPTEQIVAQCIRKAKLFLFLRQIRHSSGHKIYSGFHFAAIRFDLSPNLSPPRGGGQDWRSPFPYEGCRVGGLGFLMYFT
jgi:hypothetical protein